MPSKKMKTTKTGNLYTAHPKVLQSNFRLTSFKNYFETLQLQNLYKGVTNTAKKDCDFFSDSFFIRHFESIAQFDHPRNARSKKAAQEHYDAYASHQRERSSEGGEVAYRGSHL